MTKVDLNIALKSPFAKRYENYIGGEWRAPQSGQVFRQHFPDHRPADLRGRALRRRRHRGRARRRPRRQGRLGPHRAGRARADPQQDRRPHGSQSRQARARRDLGQRQADPRDDGRRHAARDRPFPLFRRRIRAQEGSISEIDHDTVAYHFHEPLGVVGQIIPWNFPILMAVWKLAPALAAGNCVVLKPAEQTPASILVLMELIGDLLPKGVLNIVNGFGLEAGKPLASSNRIAKIAFTGETTTGRLIMQYASQNLIPVTLELGGKSPNIFFDDVGRQGRRLLRQGDRRLRHVRAQPGRGLHLPEPRADPGVDLRPVHGAGAEARRRDHAGQPARSRDHDRRAGLLRAAREDPLLHRHRQEGRRRGPDRRRAQHPRGRATRAAIT